jgi:transcription antitermination factor NusG
VGVLMGWYCLIVNDKYVKKDNIPLVKGVIKKILGNKTEIFCLEHKEETSLDGYYFVKSDCLIEKIYSIKNSAYFSNVLNSFSNVVEISDEEIEKMKSSVENKYKQDFCYGDIVVIKQGEYSNLYGVVLNVKTRECDIGVKFCTGNFLIKVKKDDLKKEKNVFNYIRKPFNVRK